MLAFCDVFRGINWPITLSKQALSELKYLEIAGFFRTNFFINEFSRRYSSSLSGGMMLVNKRTIGLLTVDIDRREGEVSPFKWKVITSSLYLKKGGMVTSG